PHVRRFSACRPARWWTIRRCGPRPAPSPCPRGRGRRIPGRAGTTRPRAEWGKSHHGGSAPTSPSHCSWGWRWLRVCSLLLPPGQLSGQCGSPVELGRQLLGTRRGEGDEMSELLSTGADPEHYLVGVGLDGRTHGGRAG